MCIRDRQNTEIKSIDCPELEYFTTDTPYPRGEILLRGPAIFLKYFKDLEKTEEILDSNGWLHTGDIAELITNNMVENAIKIIDRKKNIVKMQQGEWIAIERVQSAYARATVVAEICVWVESSQAYVIAIVVPDQEVIEQFAEEKQIQGNFEELCRNQEIYNFIYQQLIQQGKICGLKQYEQVKRIHLETKSFAEFGLLTPSFKLKRFQFKKQYQKIIDKLYICLLYTSPSPRDRQKSRMPSSA
eukprot:TRINITY_DN4180_c0_g1_i2.p1 TRINITY_DN4180_c0_g1~~TRINITY_DN4180_c0_g1_i2.p1  ORF type:complete len:279 (-),score=52.52 TRINITY_DN4180_c0_g1_i2:23-754(-)